MAASSFGTLGHATAGAQIFDTLTFIGPISAGATATVTMTAVGGGDSFMELKGSAPDGTQYSQAFDCTASGSFVCENGNENSIGSYAIHNVGNSYSLSESFNLSDLNNNTLAILFYLGTFGGQINDPITISTPAGVTYTSASGLFLTGTTPVPVPGAMPMMLGGLLALRIVCRKPRRAVTN